MKSTFIHFYFLTYKMYRESIDWIVKTRCGVFKGNIRFEVFRAMMSFYYLASEPKKWFKINVCLYEGYVFVVVPKAVTKPSGPNLLCPQNPIFQVRIDALKLI